MNALGPARTLSDLAHERMLSVRGEPLFYARWDHAVFIHYEADRHVLQRSVPFPLELHEGRAFVSLVAFTLRRMRPRRGGRIGEWLLKPVATHEFLNVRTYVRVHGEPGIFFLAEWLSNLLSVPLGPALFGLPYRYGQISYDHADATRDISGHVEAKPGRLAYQGILRTAELAVCEPGSLTEFLMERYTAFTHRFEAPRMFRVWHEPWAHAPLDVDVVEENLLRQTGEWWNRAQYAGATYSPGVDVWMGRPLRVR
jgi:uncharacterized protein YqjF (DUF2071 family)